MSSIIKNNNGVRDSNFELLRFVSMIMIVLHHFVVYGTSMVLNDFNLSNIVYCLLYSGGKLGVALFVMITGYFMISKDKVDVKKMIKMELQVLFYSLLIFLVFNLFNIRQMSAEDVFRCFLPNFMNTYWFFSSYFALCFFIPYINKFIKSLGYKEFRGLLIFSILFLLLFPSLFFYRLHRAKINEGIYLIFYYLVGAFIKLYGEKFRIKKFYLGLFSGVVYGLIGVLPIMFSLTLSKGYIGYEFIFSEISSILIFIVAVLLFLFFRDLDVGKSGAINLLGSVSFGVYLFHDHFLIRDSLWKVMFNFSNYYNNWRGLLSCGIVVAVLIYMVGGVIEFIRKCLVDECLFPLVWDRVSGLFKRC